MRIVDEIYDFGASWFGISGGEPLLRKDLFEIIGHAREIGLDLSLITNGAFVEGKIFDSLVRNEVRVSVSIDGTEEANDALRGKGAYAKAVSAMEKLSKEGLLDCLVATFANVNSTLTNVTYKAFPSVELRSILIWLPLQSSMSGLGTKSMICARSTMENRKSTCIVPSLLALQSSGVCPILNGGLRMFSLADVSSPAGL